MRRAFLFSLLVPVALFGAACGDDDDTAATTTAGDEATTTTAGGGDFCEAASAFAEAQADAPDADTPVAVQETVEAMSQTAQELADVAPEDVTDDAQAFADAIGGLEDFAAAQGYEVDLGAGAEIYQSGEGQGVVDEIEATIVPVDQAVQDECDRFLTETG